MGARWQGEFNSEDKTFQASGRRQRGRNLNCIRTRQALQEVQQNIISANTLYTTLYLGAIVAANLLVAAYGPAIAVVNAFFLIGLDLTSRDALHDAWRGEGLKWKMALLIGAGSVLSWFFNRDAGQIAVASFFAFALAAISDTIVYSILGKQIRLVRMNGSNLVSASVDSIVFPALAFGFPLLWGIMAGQFVAKVAGGFLWSLLIHRIGGRSLARA